MHANRSLRRARHPAIIAAGATGAVSATAATLVLVLLVVLQAYAGPGTWRPSGAGVPTAVGESTLQAMPYCYMGRPTPPGMISPPCRR